MERAALIGLLCLVCAQAQQSGQSLDDALARMRAGDLVGAEQLLRPHPGDADALGLLAVVLDQEKNFSEAGETYLRALRLQPRVAALLNNYGNHLVATGRSGDARVYFLRAVAVQPTHNNAHLQLARIALEQRDPKQALAYLEQLPSAAQKAPAAALLRMQALYAMHHDADAQALLVSFAGPEFEDAAIGRALASVGQYGQAQIYLERALGQSPQNADLLYELAAVQASLHENEKALALLAQAAKLAPDRADVQKLLARTAAQLGFAGDAAQAWVRYTALAPQDDEGRRERAFAQTGLGENTAEAIVDLRWFVQRYPRDAVGHYELGTAIAATLPAEARTELDRALSLQKDLAGAHIARGILNYREAKFNEALSDFRLVAEHDPTDGAVLDRVGETYLALGQPRDAVVWLRRAAVLAPREPRILLHLGRAFAGSGEAEESAQVLARFRELGADKSGFPRAAGVIDFLNLSPEERLARYRAGVEKTVQTHADDPEAQVHYLGLVLDRGDFASAAAVSQTILSLNPSRVLRVEATDMLVAAEQFALAKRFIEASPDQGALAIDRALVALNLESPQAALFVLETVPGAERTGDYYLANALILLDLNRSADATQSLSRALQMRPARADLYQKTAQMLLRKRQNVDARKLLESAVQRFPERSSLVELQAAAQ